MLSGRPKKEKRKKFKVVGFHAKKSKKIVFSIKETEKKLSGSAQRKAKYS